MRTATHLNGKLTGGSGGRFGIWNRPGVAARMWKAILWLAMLAGTAGFGLNAAEKEFSINGQVLALREVTAETDVFYRFLRYNRLRDCWNVEVTVTNQGSGFLPGPIVLEVDGYEGTSGLLEPDGADDSDPPKAFLHLSGQSAGGLNPGEGTPLRTISLGYVPGNGTVPKLTTKVYALAEAELQAAFLARTLSASGVPLDGATARRADGGEALEVEDGSGLITLPAEEAETAWMFSREGFTPVWRSTAAGQGVKLLASPRLTRRSTNAAAISPLNGGTLMTPEISISFGPGEARQATSARLTSLTPQSLPALLPPGWSPLQAFWFEADAEPGGTGTGLLQLWDELAADDIAALVRWDAASLEWKVVERYTSPEGASLTVPIAASGAYAVVVADKAPSPVPPEPAAGQALGGVAPATFDAGSLSAEGEVSPPTSPASPIPELVTATASVKVESAAGPLSSGLVLRGEVTEAYFLRDETERHPPRYEASLIGYQRPGDEDASTLHLDFPMRPVLLFPAEELAEGIVRVEVIEEEPFGGRLIGPGGGQVQDGGVRLLAGAGAFDSPEAVLLRELDPGLFLKAVDGAGSITAAFELNAPGVADGQRLAARFDSQEPNTHFVLARVIAHEGITGLEPVERLMSNGSGELASAEPAAGERLPGVAGSGQYVLVKVASAQGLVSGVARDASGNGAAGLFIRISGQPWAAISREGGIYQLIAPAGPVEVLVRDPANGNSGSFAGTLPGPGAVLLAGLEASPSGPRVLEVTPAPGSERVPLVSSVEVRFSEPIAPASLAAGGVALLGTNGTPVAGSLGLNLSGTAATFLPSAQLAPETEHTIVVSTGITDLNGLPLEGENTFTFTTQSAALDRGSARLVIYEPGATNVPAFVLSDIPAYEPGEDPFAVVVHGEAGVADPEVAVILANESTGETATVLSKPDGSFSSVISGTEDDFVSATFVNRNGTRIYVPVSRQEFDNGFVGLYRQGGILEAESDGGPVQVIVEPAAIETKTKLRIAPIDMARLTQALGTLPADGAVLLGGFSMAVEGDELSVGADVSFPVDPAQLGLPPGAAPEEATFALTVPQELDDGAIAYEIIDQMHYEDGKLVTHSPPFAGVLLKQITKRMVSSKKLKLSNKILNALGLPGIQETITHQLMLPIMMAAGSSLRVAGRVYAAKFDEDGNVLDDTRRVVPGALVTYHHEGIQGRAGRIRPGTTFATADSRGHYAFLMPVDLISGPAGFNLIATHPEFFPQSAYGSGVVENLAGALQTPVLNVPLYFTVIDAVPQLGDDRVPPQIYISQSPRDPPPGTNELEGVTITISARDDREAASLTLAIEDYKPLNPAVTNIPPAPAILNEVETTFGPVLREKTFRLQSPIRASLTVKATANDLSGNLREARFPVVFGGDRIFPEPTGDAPGPRLISSWPPDGATGVRPGEPLVLRFALPLKENMADEAAAWLTASGAAIQGAELSTDRRSATIAFTADPGVDLTFTIQTALLGANAKPFDQDPGTDGNQTHSIAMKMVPGEEVALSGIESGGGIVVQGGFAYALERRGPLDGSVAVFDLTRNPPAKVAEISVPGFPRDLAIIPQYSYRVTEAGDCVTGDLLAVTGGKVGGEAFQYLWIIDVSDPLRPRRLASTAASFAISAIRKVAWSPPFVAYLESGAELTSVSLVNLQTFILGMNASPEVIATWPAEGRAGADLNNDGDYCDPGDELPLPFSSGSFFGKDFTITVNTTQRIQDFDLDADEGLVGLVLGAGHQKNPDGTPDASSPAPPAYRTAFSGLGRPDPALATVEFGAEDHPKRVAVFTDVLLRRTDGPATRRNLAIVSLAKAGGENQLVVIDISDVEAPVILAELDLSEFGIPQTLTRREDGLLALATSTDVLLFDPAKFLLPETPFGTLPSLMGRIPGLGSGMQSFAAPESGLNAVNAGGRAVLLNTGPSLRIVNFPTTAPLPASEIADSDDADKFMLLSQAALQTTLLKARLYGPGTSNSPPVLRQPDAANHYYVRVDALGRPDQPYLELTLEVLNNAGFPLSVGGSNALPARLAAVSTLQALGQTNASANLPRQLRAYRLSEAPGHPLHSVYLAGPLIILDRTLSTNQAQEVQIQLPRNVVRAGRALWVGIDPGSASATLHGGMLSQPAGTRLAPGVSAFASIIHDERPLIVIPGIAGSHLENMESFTRALLSERWPGYLSTLQKELTLDPDEEQKEIGASDVIRQIPEDYNVAAGNILPLLGVQQGVYQPLIRYLIDELGYIEYDYISEPGLPGIPRPENFAERRTLEGMVSTEIARGPNLFVFPYDWRLDNATNAARLAEYVKVIRAIHPAMEQVDILAHSMGGLVARRFILDNPGLVDRCITIGTPFLGAPKAIAALETGDFDDVALNIIIIKPLLKKLAEFFPAVHQLLPSEGYFELGGTPLAEAGWDFDADGDASESYDYGNYKQVIDEVFHTRTNVWPVATNEVFHAYASAAQAVNKQDDWRQDATGVEYFHIYGEQSVPNTVGEVRLARTLRPVEPPPDLRIGLPNLQSTEGDVNLPLSPPFLSTEAYVMHPRLDVVRVPGDGTVPVLSASRQGAADWNAPGARLLKVKSHSKEEDEGADHNGMLANPLVHQWIGEILRGGEPIVPSALTASAGGGKPFIHVEIVNAVPESAYAVDNATGKSSKPSAVAGDRLNFMRMIPFLGGFEDGDKNLYAVEFSITDADYDIFFEAGEQPVSIIARIGTGTDVTSKIIRRDLEFPSGTEVRIQAAANSGTITVTPAGTSPEPAVTLSGAEALNNENPSLDYTLDFAKTEVTFNPLDDLTAPGEIALFGGYDQGWDDDFDSELLYALPDAKIAVDSLESRSFYTVAQDENGNLSEPEKAAEQQTEDFDCTLLQAKRDAILDVIKQGLEEVKAEGWLLDYQHVSILEQGSGTCLWAGQDSCDLCAEVYSPKESDHDYEVFLRVFVQGVPGAFTASPHLEAHRRGDWYFKPPVLQNGQWTYTKPDNTVMTRPGGGRPEVPAQIITRRLNDKVGELGYDKQDDASPWPYPILPDISFFPVRFEYFTNAVLDLELPPPDGGDPIGDAGLGRQMLLLKWVLEGDYVPVTDPPIYQGEDLDVIFERMKARGAAGLPSIEGYEWAQLQLHAALGSGLMLRVVNPDEPFDSDKVNRGFLYNLKRKQIKKAGKAAIRASLALMVASDIPNRADFLFSVDRSEMAAFGMTSFEEVIAFLAKQQDDLFGRFTDRMDDFLSAKLANQDFINSLLADECKLNQFLADAMNLLFKVNAETLPEWQLSVSLLQGRPEELFFRTNNIQTLRDGFESVSKPGLTELLDEAEVTLPVRLINDGPLSLNPVTASMSVDGNVTVTVTTNLAPMGYADLTKGPFTLTRSLTSGSPEPVILTVSSASLADEARIANNWIGLEIYILDLANPCNIPEITMPNPALDPGDPEAARLFRKTPYFFPGFKPQELADLFDSHFGEPPQRIYVVGSHTLGKADASSDIDVIFVTGQPIDKESTNAFPFFKALNPQLAIPPEVTHLGNPEHDPEAADLDAVSPDPDPAIGARRLPKAGTLDPFFETIYEVNRFGLLVWPE